MAEKTRIKLSYEKALELLNRAVEEKGSSYVYEKLDQTVGCVYAVRDENRDLVPSCIVGHVLNYINPLFLAEAHQKEGRSAYAVLPNLLETDSRTAVLLHTAQAWQDKGETWGEAVKQAQEESK